MTDSFEIYDRWTHNEVISLLELWEEFMPKIRKVKRSLPLYHEMAKRLQVEIRKPTPYNARDIHAKLDTLKRQFAKHKKKLLTESTPSTWKYYNRVCKILEDLPASDNSKHKSNSQNESIVASSMSNSVPTEERFVIIDAEELQSSSNPILLCETSLDTPISPSNPMEGTSSENSVYRIDGRRGMKRKLDLNDSLQDYQDLLEKANERLNILMQNDERKSKEYICALAAKQKRYTDKKKRISSELKQYIDAKFQEQSAVILDMQNTILAEVRRMNDGVISAKKEISEMKKEIQSLKKSSSSSPLSPSQSISPSSSSSNGSIDEELHLLFQGNLFSDEPVIPPIPPTLLQKNKRKFWVKPTSSEWYENIFPILSDEEFKEKFRVDKTTFSFLVNRLRSVLKKTDTNFRKSITVEKRVAISLYHLSARSEYRRTSQIFGIGSSTAQEIVMEFAEAVISNLKDEFVEFTNTEERLKCAASEFETVHKLPQCAGVIGDCYIRINSAKSQHDSDSISNSIILSAVSDAHSKFCFIDVRIPKRDDSSGLLKMNQELWDTLSSGLFDEVAKNVYGVVIAAYLLGDNSFSLMPHLLKPYEVETEKWQTFYNLKLYDTRRVVEKAFTHLKGRFRIISKRMEGKAISIIKLIECCCVLHNVCEKMNDAFQETWQNGEIEKGLTVKSKQLTYGGLRHEYASKLRDLFARGMYKQRK